jgi:uncharacterized protein YuzE
MDERDLEDYVEQLTYTDRAPSTWAYDQEADVLYVTFGEIEPAISIDTGSGVLINFRESDGVILGVTIIGVGRMLKDGWPERESDGGRRIGSATKS